MHLSNSLGFWGASCTGCSDPQSRLQFELVHWQRGNEASCGWQPLLSFSGEKGAEESGSFSLMLICCCSVAPWIYDGILLKVTVNVVLWINHNIPQGSEISLVARWHCNQRHGVRQAGMVCFWVEVSYKLHDVSFNTGARRLNRFFCSTFSCLARPSIYWWKRSSQTFIILVYEAPLPQLLFILVWFLWLVLGRKAATSVLDGCVWHTAVFKDFWHPLKEHHFLFFLIYIRLKLESSPRFEFWPVST